MEKKNRVTIKDVAKEAGVSISTVSKALNRVEGVTDETREAIENIARKMSAFFKGMCYNMNKI